MAKIPLKEYKKWWGNTGLLFLLPSGFPVHYIAHMDLLDHLNTDILTFLGFIYGMVFDLHRGHGLVEVIMGILK
jgi:hypothetical protein